MSKYYCINFYTKKNHKYCSFIVINIHSHETIEQVKNDYMSFKMDQTVFEISKFDYDETKAPFKIVRFDTSMTFKDLYIQLVDQAKIDYPDNEYIQDICYIYNINHLCVSEVFTPLEMLENRLTGDIDTICFEWRQLLFDKLDLDIVNSLIVDFKLYFDNVKDCEV